MQDEIIPADRAMRQRLLWAMVVIVAVGCLYFWYLFAEIERVSAAPEADLGNLMRQLRWMSLGLVGVSAALSAYLWAMALRVFGSGRFPPPGTRVVRDTRVRTGWRARVTAAVAALAGTAVVVVSLAVHWIITRFIEAEVLY